MKIFKKSLCMLLAILLCMTSVAFADYTAEIQKTQANRVAYITGESADLARKEITLLIKNSDGEIAFLNQVTADGNGKYGFDVTLDGIELTNENVLISAQGANVTKTIKNITEFSEMYKIELDATYKKADEKLKIQLDVDNIFNESDSFCVISGLYDKNNIMLDARINPIVMDGLDYSDEIILEDLDERTEYVKVYCWKSMSSLVPVKEAGTYNASANLFLISDSLCMDYTGVANYYPQTGWGQIIGDYVKDGLKVTNLARGGYSLKDLKERKLPYAPEKDSKWDIMMKDIEEGDYVIISSNINDAGRSLLIYQDTEGTLYKWINKNEETGKQRFAKSNGNGAFSTNADNIYEFNWSDLTMLYDSNAYPFFDSTTATYKTRLADMIAEIKSVGANPIVVGSTYRECPLEGDDILLRPYVLKNAAKEVAQEEDVLFIDMYEIASKHYEDLGGSQTAMDKYALTETSIEYYKNLGEHPLNDFTSSTTDWVHYNPEGAKMVANTIAYMVKKSDNGLADFIKDDIQPYISNIEDILNELN